MLTKLAAAAIMMIALVLNDCGQQTKDMPEGDTPLPEQPGEQQSSFCVAGTMTDRGVECPALMGDDGKLYTVAGNLAGFAAGDPICVCGTPAEISYCQQGQTIAMEKAGPTCPR